MKITEKQLRQIIKEALEIHSVPEDIAMIDPEETYGLGYYKGKTLQSHTAEPRISDNVVNVNPNCDHHGSKGIVVAVNSLPRGAGKTAQYQCSNQGPTWKKGEVLEKTLDQLATYNPELDLNEAAMDWVQGGLDVVGLIPGAGEPADAVNALISLARGNPLEALLSAVSMIPAAGDAVGKGGKIVLKVLDPVMDMIKHGDEAALILKKLGPKTVEKSKGALKIVKDAVVKYGPQLKQLFKHVKAKDLDALEKLAGVKIPDIARKKAVDSLGKAADVLPEADIQSIFKFLAKMDIGDKIMGTDDYKDEVKDDIDDTVETEKLAAGYIHHQSLGASLFGESYANEKLLIISAELFEG